MPPIQSAELKALVEGIEHGLLVRLIGTADLRVTETVEQLLTSVHQQATAGKVAEVRVDLRDLEFMNSSCFKSFVLCGPLGHHRSRRKLSPSRARLAQPAAPWSLPAFVPSERRKT